MNPSSIGPPAAPRAPLGGLFIALAFFLVVSFFGSASAQGVLPPCDAQYVAASQKPYKPTGAEAVKFFFANKKAILASGRAEEITVFMEQQQGWKANKPIDLLSEVRSVPVLPPLERNFLGTNGRDSLVNTQRLSSNSSLGMQKFAMYEAQRNEWGGMTRERLADLRFTKEFGELSLLGRGIGTNILVGSADPAPGGIAGAAPSQLLVKLKDQSGKDCYRLANSTDFIAKGAIGAAKNSKLVVDLRGFGEVALIVKRPDGTSGKPKAHCSGVVVGTSGSQTYVLTAAHCVNDLNEQQIVAHGGILRSPSRFRVLLPKDPLVPGDSEAFDRCFSPGNNQCHYIVGTVTQLPDFAPESRRCQNAAGDCIVNDMALLTAVFDAATPQFARISGASNTHAGEEEFVLTHAGYGYGDNNQQPGSLAVGPILMSASLVIKPPGFISIPHDPKRNPGSNACQFDSGSPVFDGAANGNSAEQPRTLLGLVSLVSNGESSKACAQSTEEKIQAITPNIYQWLCADARQPWLEGCK